MTNSKQSDSTLWEGQPLQKKVDSMGRDEFHEILDLIPHLLETLRYIWNVSLFTEIV